MNRALAFGAALAASLALQSCMLLDRSTQVSIGSDPPGARVLVDDRDSGFVTPCLIELDPGNDTQIDLLYPGYVRATRVLTTDHQLYAILWSDMYVRSQVWKFPLWLNSRDLFVPVKYDRTLSPGRLYIKLERTADT